jgi:hypothetical protein
MKVKDLIEEWEQSAAEPLTAQQYTLRLPVRDAARVRALARMYPRRSVDELLTDLLTAALDEVEEAMPYEQGQRVIAEDEQGDPIFEDAGPAARFRRLSEEFTASLLRDASNTP